MSNLGEIAQKKDFEKFEEVIGNETDPTMLILRSHLFSEYLLERLIIFNLPRGDKIMEYGNLSYYQKLVLVESLECLSDSIISSLRNLNKLRNQCSHELNKKITESDITKIGSPLGKEYTRLKRESEFNEIVLLRGLINYICGYLSGYTQIQENPDIFKKYGSEDNKT